MGRLEMAGIHKAGVANVRSAPASSDAFVAPPDYAFEPELCGPVPRPIPDYVRQGRYARQRRGLVWGLFGAAGVCLMLAPAPFVREAGLYIVPLAYLSWIGFGLLAAWAGVLAWDYLVPGPYRYIRDGQPVVVRVVSVVKAPSRTFNGMTITYRFLATIESQDGLTGRAERREVRSNEFHVREKDVLTVSYRAGEYATGVYVPGKFGLTLYGFLDLNPEIGILRRDDRDRSLARALAVKLTSLALLLAVASWNMIAMARYEPLDLLGLLSVAALPVLGGTLVFGGGAIAVLVVLHRRELRRIAVRNARAAARGEPREVPALGEDECADYGNLPALGIFSLAFAAATTFCGVMAANAVLDNSAPQERPVEIRGLEEHTFAFLFRRYAISFAFLDQRRGRWIGEAFTTTPDHMEQFADTDRGIAVIHAGRFGCPWVKSIRPAPPEDDLADE